ncbi:MAG: GTPase ObgE, partial [Serratia symbiotica]|nr:GTPase ObgE [Serratia symbiotica]
KPRWLVFNKVDLLDEEEAAERAKAIVAGMGWEGEYYLISAANREGVNALCWDVMNFINTQPKALAIEESAPEKVEFMWDNYHREQIAEAEAEDDWDEDDDEGVEIIYQK